jgi:hypothetical protein
MAGIIYTPAPTPPTPPGGLDRNVQYNNGGVFGGLRFLEADAAAHHQQFITPLSQPATPPADRAIIYASNDDGDQSLQVLNSFSKDYPLQLGIGHKIVGMAWPGNGSTALASFAWSGYVNSGTGSWSPTTNCTKSYTAGTALPNISRYNGQTLAAIGSSAEIFMGTQNRSVVTGSALQAWGVKLIVTFGCPTYVNTQRFFIGYSQFSAALNGLADPSSFINSIAIIKDVSDTTFNFFFRGLLGSTKINTGITPAVNGVYRATIFIPSVGTTAYMNFQEIGTNTVSSASISNSSTIPPVGTNLYPHMMVGNGATLGAVNISLIQMHEEQL